MTDSKKFIPLAEVKEILLADPEVKAEYDALAVSTKFQPGKSGNPAGRPKGTVSSDKVQDDDRAYYGTDSRKFLERALLRAKTWEEGLKYAKELRMLQHPSLQSVQTRADNVHTITLRWSTPTELPSNEKSMIELSVDRPNEEALPSDD